MVGKNSPIPRVQNMPSMCSFIKFYSFKFSHIVHVEYILICSKKNQKIYLFLYSYPVFITYTSSSLLTGLKCFLYYITSCHV